MRGGSAQLVFVLKERTRKIRFSTSPSTWLTYVARSPVASTLVRASTDFFPNKVKMVKRRAPIFGFAIDLGGHLSEFGDRLFLEIKFDPSWRANACIADQDFRLCEDPLEASRQRLQLPRESGIALSSGSGSMVRD